MLGCVVGIGNIWRLPHILALHAEEGGESQSLTSYHALSYVPLDLSTGALAFLIAWFIFLFIWSIPLILIENGVGQFTGKAPVEAFSKLLGPSYCGWMGAFVTIKTSLIG